MYIYQKWANHIINYLALKFLGKGYSKVKKNYASHLQEGLKSHLASTALTNFGTTNFCHFIRECLEFHPLCKYHQSLGTQPRPNQWQDSGSHPTASSSFTNAFEISNIIPLFTKVSCIGHLLWRIYYCHSEIKDLPSAGYGLCKYT